jgi:site-specific recombinase XerD
VRVSELCNLRLSDVDQDDRTLRVRTDKGVVDRDIELEKKSIHAKGWFYPKEKTLMVWECFLENRHRITNRLDEENRETIWRGFERILLERSVGAEVSSFARRCARTHPSG